MSLEVQDLTIDLGDRRVVDGVSFAVPDGARIGLIGESGSGKSLTALAILGLLPDGATAAGSVRWNGREILGLRDAELAELHGRLLASISPAGKELAARWMVPASTPAERATMIAGITASRLNVATTRTCRREPARPRLRSIQSATRRRATMAPSSSSSARSRVSRRLTVLGSLPKGGVAVSAP